MSSIQTLSPFLRDTSVSELMWNDYATAFVESHGRLIGITSPFSSEQEFEDLLALLRKLPNTVNPMGLFNDGILPDGSRFHITCPPLSPKPTLTIRKFSSAFRDLESLVAAGFCSQKARKFLEACVRGRVNIIVSGSTGAGKTTLLQALAAATDLSERIISIEDIPELQLHHPNWVRLLAVPSDKGVSVRECLVGCLRMRPDRILVGECRSDEAVEMLNAMNTGHDGGITTLHANSSVEAITRLESLILFHAAAEIPLKALRKQIADAVDLIVQVKKGPDGRRMIDEVTEIVGMEGDVVTRLPLFKSVNGKLLGTGHTPTFMKQLGELGAVLPQGFFDAKAFET